MQPGADVGGIGMGLVRMVRPWNEWLIVWGYDISQPAPQVDEEFATKVARDLVGDPESRVEIQSVVDLDGQQHATPTTYSNGRVFCMGDAAHRHPPSNGLGSNTSIQDAFNLAWKLAHGPRRARPGPGCSTATHAERAPVAKQIVTRANKSIAEFGPIFEALGPARLASTRRRCRRTWMRACDDTPEARSAARGSSARRSPSRCTSSTPTASR